MIIFVHAPKRQEQCFDADNISAYFTYLSDIKSQAVLFEHLIHLLEDLCDAFPRDDTILSFISLDSEETVTEITTPHMSQKVLVMSNHNKLEIALCLSGFDDHMETLRQTLDIVAIQVCGGLIECDKATVDAERLSQS